jgi:cohesin complex subunit SA-1/2
VAAEWVSRYNEHNSNAMAELINFVLKCTGCTLQVDSNDVEDVDNVTGKLTDLQEEYQAQKITDYPLISKTRGTVFSRATMTGFFHSLIATVHASGLLYNDIALIENIQVWVTTMSSSGIRPFRHTATVISLAIATAMCNIMKDIVENTATTMRQKESEQKKKSVNKGRVAALQAKVDGNEKKREQVEGWLRDVFDTVFIHRYRDVDAKIRVDCVTALGNWIATCRDIFFESQYLRYLGWVLSDSSAATRAEVVKQLLRLYKHKDNVGRLRGFTERFRPRMVEMATRDAEPTIRASVVELLDLIRGVGLLEPDDIDVIGKLVFDSEPRVRKAVAGFFAENISDLYESAIEELGGEETLDEVIGEIADDDYDNPRQAWLKLKCLAEVLQSYDTSGAVSPPEAVIDPYTLGTVPLETRYAMAAQAICEEVPEVKEWEVVAGYLLYDHSSASENHDTDDAQATFKARCQLNEKEERLLLEVLNAAVKLRLTEAVESEIEKKGKRTKARKDESREIQESTALHLAQVIPRLLRKFGASPSTASAVLRLEHVLNLEIFQELRQDSTEYASLLDDISKQFLTHADHNVLADAKTALLQARGYEDLEEVTESKLQELWEDTLGTLRQLYKAKKSPLSQLANTVHRLSNLASISNCVEILEAEPRPSGKGNSKAGAGTKATDILLDLLRTHGSDEDANSKSLILAAMKCLLFYHMWILRDLKERIQGNEETEDLPNYDNFAAALQRLIETRPKLDDVRLAAMGNLLDLHMTFATLRHSDRSPKEKSADGPSNPAFASLIRPIAPNIQEHILSSFVAAEKAYARKTKRTLEEPDNDDAPDDPESEPEESSDEEDAEDEEEQDRRTQRRLQEMLFEEKRLCEFTGKIVLAIVAQVLDSSGPKKGSIRKRLLRNKAKLGHNFKDVLGYLEEPKAKRSHKAKAKGATKGAVQERVAAKSKAIVTEEDDEDEVEDVVEEGGEEDLRRRGLQDDIVDDRGGEHSGKDDNVDMQDAEDDDVLGD